MRLKILMTVVQRLKTEIYGLVCHLQNFCCYWPLYVKPELNIIGILQEYSSYKYLHTWLEPY